MYYIEDNGKYSREWKLLVWFLFFLKKKITLFGKLYFPFYIDYLLVCSFTQSVDYICGTILVSQVLSKYCLYIYGNWKSIESTRYVKIETKAD